MKRQNSTLLIFIAVCVAVVGGILLLTNNDGRLIENDNSGTTQGAAPTASRDSLITLKEKQTKTLQDLGVAVLFESVQEITCTSCIEPRYAASVLVTTDQGDGRFGSPEMVRFDSIPSSRQVGNILIQAVELTDQQDLRLFVRKIQ